MNEALAAHIYSNMPGSLARPEEHEITRHRLVNIERLRGPQLFSGGPCHQYAGLTVGIKHKTATVKTPRIITAVVIGNADHSSSRERNEFKNEEVTRRGSSWSTGGDTRCGSQAVRHQRCELRGYLGYFGWRGRDGVLGRLRRVIGSDGAGSEHERKRHQTGSHNSVSLEHRGALPGGWGHATKMG
jgi:hypothetical protein